MANLKRTADFPPGSDESPTKISKINGHGEVLLAELECPVCLDYPRVNPIYTCQNGHLVCAPCRHKMTGESCQECRKACKSHVCTAAKSCPLCKTCLGICPTCRNHNIKLDIRITVIADKLLRDVIVECKFAVYGCTTKFKLAIIHHHEKMCAHREIRCPSHHEGRCKWTGTLMSLEKHGNTSQCFLLRSSNNKHPLPDHLATRDWQAHPWGNRQQPNPTTVIGLRYITTNWKPILLTLDPAQQAWGIYGIIQRTQYGMWTIVWRTYRPQGTCENIILKMEIFKANHNDVAPRFVYEGEVNPSTLQNNEAIATGKYLALTDAQVNSLKSKTTLLEYRVTVSERQQCHKATQTTISESERKESEISRIIGWLKTPK